ncbi:hypothetical protein K435DRAFT_772286 [Dendrothele bispora CBS 962.96]|uniref:Uncharacterized protein n=1 Tax=Dendrothele bispora (strain CBS 962.96) TaxID=1314807 RepID=A0A4S8MXV6_DENBC|nr:hypothetical protein K435DRAFT_772286 [Dendrothele bispora CBS 962.96]
MRYTRRITFGVLLFFSIALFLNNRAQKQGVRSYPQSRTSWKFWSASPPLYEEWHAYERSLPQHDLSLPPPEGRAAKFVFMANHAHASGWGNVLQEMIVNAHLAYATKRAFVFYNYTWDHHESEYSSFNGKKIPSRTPVSTMLSGPIIGGSFGPNSDVPRAVHKEYFRAVCPNVTLIDTEETKTKIASHDGLTVLNGWIEKLNSMQDRCIEFDIRSDQAFDIWLFGHDEILSLWPALRESPIVTEFAFSPLIMAAFESNKHLFTPVFRRFFFFSSSSSLDKGDSPIVSEAQPISGLLTLHIRRGDFEHHCGNLEEWGAVFSGFSSFPEMPDKLFPEGGYKTRQERKDGYRRHCYPSISEIVEQVRRVRKDARDHHYADTHASESDYSELKRIYVMSNAPKEWLEELKRALFRDAAITPGEEPWEAIHTSRDLVLTWEQKHVAQALDMYVAERSQTFIGNGFSSMTSNVMMLRMANDVDAINSRLW